MIEERSTDARHITITCLELADRHLLGLQAGQCCSSCHEEDESGPPCLELSRIELPCGCVVACCCLQHGTLYDLRWDADKLAALHDIARKSA